MPVVVSWIREKDEPLFQQFADKHPAIQMLNARTQPADMEVTDGLLLTGGPDVSIGFLQQPVSDPAMIQDPEPERDAWEFQAVKQAINKRLPVLAVCKGVQVLNVALGGTLYLDIRGHDLPEMRDQNVQPLRFAENASVRFECVNSSHHQALDKLGEGLQVEAWHAEDGIIEQVRLRDYPFALGVQYHPERDLLYAPLFEQFFEAVENAAH
jgi:putative glutamine amidotransferase